MHFHTLSYISIPSNSFSLNPDTILVNDDNLDSIASVYVSLGDGVDDVLGSVLHFLNILSQSLHEIVVSNELVIKNGCTKFTSRTLHTVSELIE